MYREQQLNFLIDKLSPGTSIPAAIESKWHLYRSLVNVRQPLPVDNDFIKVQDEMLLSLIAEKGVTDIADLQPIRDNLYLWRGDITTLKVEAIVNAANSGMLGCFVPCHACIDNAIHTFAGVQLRLECAAIMEQQGHPEPTGKAKITKAYNLPSRHILHTVGPIVGGRLTERDCKLLADCYRSCLELAVKIGLKSVAFCCVSTGEYQFPNEKAAEIALKTITDFQRANINDEIKVMFNVFKEHDYEIYKRLLNTTK